jgi:4-amino-4-deoxy-L-arabinose transferase-like glycosyltransferase
MSAPVAGVVADPPEGDRSSDGSGPERPERWARPALIALLVATAGFWLFGLSRNGWANSFYSAAVQASTQSWKAFLFGSSDAGNSITVDKPPAGLWPMDISARIFGVNSWSILLPQVLLGVASVALLHAIVRRRFGPAAGLLAGLLLALTPVATLMFRYNNPDALLVFVMVAAAWALLRAVDDGRTRWLVCAGALIGLGFLTKQLQVMLIVPALATTYLIAGPVQLRTRIFQLAAALAASVVAAGWWVLLVSVVPGSQRPYVGGSTDNSFLELTFGYNGLSRLTGHRPGAFAEPSGGHHYSFGSHAGPLRLFTAESGVQISWLLPAALLLAALGLLWCRSATRTDTPRGEYLLWGGWLVVAGVVLSFMSGTFHDYYTVVLSPPVAALVGIGTTQLWLRRGSGWGRSALAVIVAGTAVWSWILLGRVPGFLPPLRWIVLTGGAVAAVALCMGRRSDVRFSVPVAAIAAAAALAGPVAYSIQTVGSAHTGGIVNAGPAMPGDRSSGKSGVGAERDRTGMGPTAVGAQIKQLLLANAGAYTWVAATDGANQAASYQLATGDAVMPIGGFNSRDPSPTLAQFQRYVADRRIHYYIEGSRQPNSESGWGAGDADRSQHTVTEADRIGDWVKHSFTASTVGDVTVYDLTRPAGAVSPHGM